MNCEDLTIGEEYPTLCGGVVKLKRVEGSSYLFTWMSEEKRDPESGEQVQQGGDYYYYTSGRYQGNYDYPLFSIDWNNLYMTPDSHALHWLRVGGL
jgi:hypothetical protein